MLVPDDELAALKAEHARALEANRGKSCKRPVLRGDAVEGPADEDILAIPKRLDVCLGALSYRADKIDRALFLGSDEAPVDDDERRVRPLDAPESQVEAVAQLDAVCEDLLPALNDAVSHEDACSPYLPGRGDGSRDLLWYPRLARPVLVRARLFARSGRPVGAARMLLDYLRLGQDLYRGGASVIEAMMANAGMRLVYDQLQQLLSFHLDRDGVAAIAGELALLEASEPGLSALFAAFPVDYVSHEVMPHLDDADDDEELGLVMSWLAFRQVADALVPKCPSGATDQACVEAYLALVVEQRKTARSIDSNALLQSDLAEIGPTVRSQVVDALAAPLVEAHLKYVARIAWRRAAIVALRWHAEARVAFSRGQPCRAPDDLGVSTLGAPIEVRGDQYTPVLRAPVWTDSGLPRAPRYLLSVNCALAPPK